MFIIYIIRKIKEKAEYDQYYYFVNLFIYLYDNSELN